MEVILLLAKNNKPQTHTYRHLNYIVKVSKIFDNFILNYSKLNNIMCKINASYNLLHYILYYNIINIYIYYKNKINAHAKWMSIYLLFLAFY